MPKARKKTAPSPKSGLWVTEVGPDGRKRNREVEGGRVLCKDESGNSFWKELPPQPIRELPPKKAPKRKAG